MGSARQLRHRCLGGEGRVGGLSSSSPASGLLCDSMKQGMFTCEIFVVQEVGNSIRAAGGTITTLTTPKYLIRHIAHCLVVPIS